MQKTKTQKGITLIALVITIIVMLILVGVSVTVALNGGLFTTAKKATADTEVERDKELEIANVSSGATTQDLINKYKGSNQSEGPGGEDSGDEVVPVGSYVHYEVTYKDVYSETMPKFTADNGWRYLGKDSDNNHLIVSTGIPAELYYDYGDADTIGNKEDRDDGKGNDWWATNAQITASETPSQYYTDKGYVYTDDATTSGEPNKYATYGMKYNFENIPFAKGTTAAKNAGIYTEINNETASVTGSVFRAEGYEDETKVQIRSLTYEDIRRVVSGSETGSGSGFKDITGTDNVALGLFDMWDLTGYGELTNYFYWHASLSGPDRRVVERRVR